VNLPIRRLIVDTTNPTAAHALLKREWLVDNGLGGYASGTISGHVERRYHGLLTAALPAPLGRLLVFNHLSEEVVLPDGNAVCIGGNDPGTIERNPEKHTALREFRIEGGVPVWKYQCGEFVVEKTVSMVHGQNTVHITYRLVAGPGKLELQLRPAVHFRPHENDVAGPSPEGYSLLIRERNYEVSAPNWPHPLRLAMQHSDSNFIYEGGHLTEIRYETEAERGYEATGVLWTPGRFIVRLQRETPATLIGSTEEWSTIHALPPDDARAADRARRERLIEAAPESARSGAGAELVLAADQFVITPAGRVEDAARAKAAGDEVRTVIAGYHWFTDWGRDTMISLEGLTLATGRHQEAAWILRTFDFYVRDGLIPNLFPEGSREGLYHTADATLWYFHAIDCYLRATGDRDTLRALLPNLRQIVRSHIAGTRFGIHVDPADGLLAQGADGYQLTWMDAKVGDWVVTPRRGKAVEINGLWYNALCLLAQWSRDDGDENLARECEEWAERARISFNRRFWNSEHDYLLDVVDGPNGDDPACRPNQLLSFSLLHPILDETHWADVLGVVRRELLTPFGLRSLAPSDPDYKANYFGDLRARDAAYHQGTVWAWLLGPFIDAWLKVHPSDTLVARGWLEDLLFNLNEGCVGSLNEIFDAKAPFTPRGCIAQAWSVAEALRCWVKTDRKSDATADRKPELQTVPVLSSSGTS
jgi:predicted glycogen debranching enzyme